jgi:hypothetical protein
MHKEMIDGVPPQTRQFRFRTGDRKIDAKDFESSQLDTGKRLVREGYLMRHGKNIPATRPFYATIAPILHKQLHGTLTQRDTTLNIGAADADGR